MILRLKGVIACDHDTKLPEEDGEGMRQGVGLDPVQRRNFEEDPRDALTCGSRNRPSPEKDPITTHSWGNRPNRKKESNVCRRGRQSKPREVHTHPADREGLDQRPQGHGGWIF